MSHSESTPHRPTQREGSEELTGDIGSAVPDEFEPPATVADATGEDTPTLSPGSALLVVKRGPNVGSQIALTRPVMSAGRHPESDIYLDDITVSRRHAEFRRENGKFHVVDLGSLNKTYLNRKPVEAAVLANGDEIRIGNFRLIFVAGPRRG